MFELENPFSFNVRITIIIRHLGFDTLTRFYEEEIDRFMNRGHRLAVDTDSE